MHADFMTRMITRHMLVAVIFFICLMFGHTYLSHAQGASGSDGTATSPSTLESTINSILDQRLLSKTSGLSLYGYVDTSYTYNFNQPQNGVNHLRIFDVDSNAFRMHMAQVVLEKEGKTDGSHLDRAGFRAKLNFGEDSQFTGGSDFNDEVDFQEAYVQYIAPIGNGLDLRMGRMNTLIGYEVIESPYNPNFTRSWLFGLGEPFTTTGARAAYQFNDWVGVAVGGISSFTQGPGDNNANLSVESAIYLTPNDMVSLTGFFFYGAEGNRNAATGDLTLFGGIASLQATEATSLVVEAYLANQANASTISPSGNARWNGVAAYLIHDFTEQWGVRFRGEIFEDAGGARTCGGTAGTRPNANVCFGATPVAQTLWEGTATLQFKPVPSLITRLEFRYDKSDKKTFRIGNRGANHQETLAFEAIYLF